MLNRFYIKAHLIFLLLIAFFIPISKKAVILLILLYGLNWLLLQNYKEKLLNLKKHIAKFLFLSFIYFIYIISLLYTSNIDSGLFDIEVKLTLFLLPLILFSNPLPLKSETDKVFKAYITGCLVGVFICLFQSGTLYFESHDLNSFVYTNFSVLFHPSYFSLYLNFAVIILFYYLIESDKNKLKKTVLLVSLITLFSISIVLANSKAVILTLFLSFFLAGLYFGHKKGFFKTAILLTLSIIIVLSFFIYKTPQLYLRIYDTERILNEYIHNENLRDYEGTSQRILIWKSSAGIIKQNLLTGVGAGDVKDILLEEYSKKNYNYIIAKSLNAHNQFIQTFIATGIFGFLVLISLFVLPLIKSYRRKNFIYFLFLLIVFLNFLTESMLETQAGVIFFAFFNSYLFAKTLNND